MNEWLGSGGKVVAGHELKREGSTSKEWVYRVYTHTLGG